MSGNSQRSYIARGDIRPSRFVKRDTATNHGVLEADLNDTAVGVSYEGTRYAPLPNVSPLAAVSGEPVLIYTEGMPCEIVAAASITPGQYLKPDADGAAIVAVAGDIYGAIADASGASGQNVKVTVKMGITPGDGLDGVLTAGVQALSGPGAVNITSFSTNWTTTGAGDAGTLANGTTVGQQKIITLVVDGGDGVLTPANLKDGTTITFSNVGDRVRLVWDGAEWVVVERLNVATGAASTPVVA
jgi:hypothetical protein